MAGGKSSRLGRDKAGLRFGAESLLERAVRRMRAVARPVLVAVAPAVPGALLAPPVPVGAEAVPDRSPQEGPLVGMAEGFRRLRGMAERVLVTPVDMPFFDEPWLARLVEGLSRAPAVLYRYEGVQNALAAGYRLELLPKLDRLIAEGRRGAYRLAEGDDMLVLNVEEFWHAGQGPPPLMDVDSAQDYREALRWEGFGDAQGVPVWVEWRATAQGNSSAPVRLPLRARTAAQALEFAARLYGEYADALHAAGTRGAVGLLRDGAAVPIEAVATLRPDDILVCEL